MSIGMMQRDYKNTEAFGLLKLVDDSDKFTISGYLKSDFTYSEDKMPEIESCL